MPRVGLAGAVLLALALRALVPIGFMPAADGSLSLMICPDGFPSALLPGGKDAMPGGMGMPGHQGGHGRGVIDDDHCIFCTGFSAAPPALVLAALVLLLAVITAAVVKVAPPADIRLVHLPRARAPPAPC